MNSFILGIMAGILCTFSFIPQVVKIFRTKNARDISLLTFSVFSLGVILWLIYGIAIKEWPIIIANAVSLILILAIVVMKVKYG